jgi:hypothetical protein
MTLTVKWLNFLNDWNLIILSYLSFINLIHTWTKTTRIIRQTYTNFSKKETLFCFLLFSKIFKRFNWLLLVKVKSVECWHRSAVALVFSSNIRSIWRAVLLAPASASASRFQIKVLCSKILFYLCFLINSNI